ncbi:MAG: acylphosphatase, partial [Bacteroidota bacterium]|nr:acylphosphatase [Bacteroidota bacterium]
MENTTYHIHLKGIVQGVGMRPAIQRFAMKWNLKGYVCNGTDGVHIEMNYQKKKGLLLFEEIVKILPPNTKVSDYRVEELAFHPYTQFEIKDSLKGASCELSLAPDYGLCPQCRKELQDPGSRRYRYPFTTCTQCGPRFSIQHSLPYDRSHTTMDHFTMCRPCETEYADTLDRRFYSQTNSCEDCGIHLTLTGPAGEEIARGNSSALDLSKDLLQKGF